MRYAALGLEFFGSVAVCVLVGWWLDKRWGTMPLMMLIGLAVGFTAALYLLIRSLPRNRDGR